MIRTARSLNPRPDDALLIKEAEAERACANPPPIKDQIVAKLDAIANDHSLERAQPVIAAWARNNRPQLVAKTKPKRKQAADALFRKGEE